MQIEQSRTLRKFEFAAGIYTFTKIYLYHILMKNDAYKKLNHLTDLGAVMPVAYYDVILSRSKLPKYKIPKCLTLEMALTK